MDDPMLKHRFVDAMDAARLCLQDAYNESAKPARGDTRSRAADVQALAMMALAQATIAVADRLEAIREMFDGADGGLPAIISYTEPGAP